MKLNAVIIDDEKDAIETLEIIINEFCENITLVGKADNVNDAINIVSSTSPDIVFLDIEMPEMSGFDLLKLLPSEKFSTIFVTAYNKYAVDAFRANAIDYLLKPINVNDLNSAVSKVIKLNGEVKPIDVNSIIKQINNNTKLQVASIDGIEYIDIKDIILISADKSYAIIHLEDRTIISSRNLKFYEEKINNSHFYRAHNSYYINLNHVIKYSYKDGARIQLSSGQEIPISRSKRHEFQQIMTELFS